MKIARYIAIATTVVACALPLAGAADTQPARGPKGDARNDQRPKAAEAQQRRKAEAEVRAGNQEKRQVAVDRREANQKRRIEAGIKHGQLTPAEVATLQSQENNIQNLETTFKTDGKLTHDETRQLRQALNDASVQIWAQRHDTEGSQKAVSRLGKDIFAKDEVTAKIESGDFTRAQARAFLEDFRKMTRIKRQLSNDTLTPEQRATLQGQYNTLLNEYFYTK